MTINDASPIIAILSALACAAPSASAQTPVHWTAAAPAVVASGAVTNVKLKASIDDGWHIYAVNQGPGGPVPTRITLASGQPFSLAGLVTATSVPRTQFDSSFGINVMMHEKLAEFALPVQVDPTAHIGVDTLHVNARYQACNASLCMPPQTAKLTAVIRAKGGK